MSTAAWAKTLRRKQVAASLEACGGPGSGVPGPCPEKGGEGGGEAPHKAPNAALPDAARPALTTAQAAAVHDYTADDYGDINDPLRAGKEPTGRFGEMNKLIQEAMAKTEPFENPVTAYRGMSFGMRGKAELAELMGKLKDASANGKELQMSGYTSTTTSKEVMFPTTQKAKFGGEVVMEIEVRRGLDVKSFSDSPREEELLLDHNSRFTVASMEERPHKNGGTYTHVKLKQVL